MNAPQPLQLVSWLVRDEHLDRRSHSTIRSHRCTSCWINIVHCVAARLTTAALAATARCPTWHIATPQLSGESSDGELPELESKHNGNHKHPWLGANYVSNTYSCLCMFVTLSNCAKRFALVINLKWLPAMLQPCTCVLYACVCCHFLYAAYCSHCLCAATFRVLLLLALSCSSSLMLCFSLLREVGGWKMRLHVAAPHDIVLLLLQPHLMCQWSDRPV